MSHTFTQPVALARHLYMHFFKMLVFTDKCIKLGLKFITLLVCGLDTGAQLTDLIVVLNLVQFAFGFHQLGDLGLDVLA